MPIPIQPVDAGTFPTDADDLGAIALEGSGFEDQMPEMDLMHTNTGEVSHA